jgi:hypothetical protein
MIPNQPAPVLRSATRATKSYPIGVSPSQNLCSCHEAFLTCVVGWSNCPPNSFPSCSQATGDCLCSCCGPGVGGGCIGPFQ